MTNKFKERLTKGEALDDILPEAFALIREAARRKLGERPFDVQIIGGIGLHQGKIVEMKTGEGKTLASVAAAYLNALNGEGFILSPSMTISQNAIVNGWAKFIPL